MVMEGSKITFGPEDRAQPADKEFIVLRRDEYEKAKSYVDCVDSRYEFPAEVDNTVVIRADDLAVVVFAGDINAR